VSSESFVFIDTSSYEQESHGRGCACGCCNRNGTSYGTRVYDVSQYPAILALAEHALCPSAWEAFSTWFKEKQCEAKEIVWGRTERASAQNAFVLAQGQGMMVVAA
jgi:hypothetical protein